MRRRLTVTGASETIDGVAKMSVSDEDQRQKMVRIPRNVCFLELCGRLSQLLRANVMKSV